jgi:hypothetical protein
LADVDQAAGYATINSDMQESLDFSYTSLFGVEDE